MRRLAAGFIFLVCVWAAHAAPSDGIAYPGKAIPFVGGKPQNEFQARMMAAVKEGKLADRMARMVNATLRLRSDVHVGFASCRRPNALFDRQRSAIVICWELLELIAGVARDDIELMTAGRTEFASTVDGAIWGIFFHELGHAVIALNGVPITGREEDVADQFALYLAVVFAEPAGIPVVKPTVWLFSHLSKRVDMATADQASIRNLMADEHSLDQQRIFNLACWSLGASPQRGIHTARLVDLPESRARRCPAEFAALERGFRALFHPYLKVTARR